MGIQKETERVSQSDSKAQGDIIKIDWPEEVSGPGFGVVINADCDIAHGKTDGVVAFLPIYPFREYLSNFWAPSHVNEVSVAATDTVLKLAGDTDAAALHLWLATSGPEVVRSEIAGIRKLRKSDNEQLGRELRRLAICMDEDKSSIERFHALCAATNDAAAYARTQITGAKKAMGEGHFFMSDLVDEPSVGFVIRMRRIYTLPEENYFVSMSDQMSKSQGDLPTAVRIARLTELYRFKVLQLFSHQYSRIGLPDEVTALSALAIDDLVAQFAGVPQ